MSAINNAGSSNLVIGDRAIYLVFAVDIREMDGYESHFVILGISECL